MDRLPATLRLFLLLLPALAAGVAAASAQPADLRPTVILVSLDGFRPDYLDRFPTPTLKRLAVGGVRARWMIPSFPTKTFPNHYTIVTGLYPGHHGVVGNTIRDVPTGRTFAMSRRDEVQDAMWWGGTPIWVLAERAGQRTAAVYWPGSEAPIQGVRPTYWEPYTDEVPGAERVQRVLALLDRPAAARPTFITLYFEHTDQAGHRGPSHPSVATAVAQVDGWLGDLVRGLDQRGLADRVNLVILSDHGMAETDRSRVVVLDDYVTDEDVEVIDLNPTVGLFPKPGREDAVYRALRGAHPRLKVYRREEAPAHWRLGTHPRVPPIVGTVDDGWMVLRRRLVERIDRGEVPRGSGQHGYDPRDASMRALFIAHGPAFKTGVVAEPFENTSVYAMLGRILGVTLPPHDGDPAAADAIMR